MLLFLLSGLLLLRLATRKLLPLLFQEPPRRTPSGVPALRAKVPDNAIVNGMYLRLFQCFHPASQQLPNLNQFSSGEAILLLAGQLSRLCKPHIQS